MDREPRVGAFVLETLTTGMYTNPLDTVREYIQNAADSIRSAEARGIITPGSGRVKVEIDFDKRALLIKDNGIGVSKDKVFDSLIDIGMSNKQLEANAGFRGIGRLAGIAYCERLIFRTSALGDSDVSVVMIDCKKIREAISPASQKGEELISVVEKNFHQSSSEQCNSEEHFFEVIMEGIDADNERLFLDDKELERYLSQVAPVEYDSHRFLFAKNIKNWAESHSFPIPCITLSIEVLGEKPLRQVFKPYKGRYKTKAHGYSVEIQDVCFYPENPDPSTPFWIWYGKSELLGMVDDEESAGLRFRKNNIALGGPERVAELFPGNEGRLNGWFIGEIHVLSNALIPNARRDGFEHSNEWVQLKKLLSPFISDLCKRCHAASSGENRPTEKVIASAKRALDYANEALRTGIGSQEEYDDITTKLSKEKERLEQVLKTMQDSPNAEKISSLISEIQDIIRSLENNANIYTVTRLPTLSRKERKVLKDTLEIIWKALSEMQCSKKNECHKALKTAIAEHFGLKKNGDID